MAMTVVNLFLPVSEADVRDPGRCTFGAVFSEEALGLNAVRIADEREGATFDVAEEGGRAAQVVLDQFGI